MVNAHADNLLDKETAKSFPKLMEGNNKIIVLFSREGRGTIIHAGIGGCYNMGYYSSYWDMDNFKDCPKELTIHLNND